MGKFQKGNKASPGRKPGYLGFNERARQLLDNLSVQQIVDHVQALRVPDRKHFKNESEYRKARRLHKNTMRLPARDFAVMMAIADAFTSGGGDGLHKLLDRIYGKPIQQLNVDQTLNANTTATVRTYAVSELEQWVDKLKRAGTANPAETPVSH